MADGIVRYFYRRGEWGGYDVMKRGTWNDDDFMENVETEQEASHLTKLYNDAARQDAQRK